MCWNISKNGNSHKERKGYNDREKWRVTCLDKMVRKESSEKWIFNLRPKMNHREKKCMSKSLKAGKSWEELSFSFFFFKIYLFKRERECEQGKGQRERISSRLKELGPHADPDPQTWDHDRNWNQESDVQPTKPLRRSWKSPEEHS